GFRGGEAVGVDSRRWRPDRHRRAPGRSAEHRHARPGDPGIAARPDLLARLPARGAPRLARPLLHLSIALRLLDVRSGPGARLSPDVHLLCACWYCAVLT